MPAVTINRITVRATVESAPVVTASVPQSISIQAEALARGPRGLSGDGSGDMLVETYDPTLVQADAFYMDNMNEGTDGKIFTSDERSKLDGIEAGAEVNTVDSVAGRQGDITVTKGDVGLVNVDNTSDLSKPISTATQGALNNKVDGTVKLTVSGSAPSSPSTNDLWVDISE